MSLGAECPAVAWHARLGKPTAPVSAVSPLPTWSAGCRSFKSFGQVLQAVFEISHHIVLLVNPALEDDMKKEISLRRGGHGEASGGQKIPCSFAKVLVI